MNTMLGLALAFVELAAAASHTIVAGQGGLAFGPSMTTASVGDTILVNFMPTNHTIAQSTASSPCTYMPGGFYAGEFFPVSSGTASTGFQFTVNSTDPIYFFCPQTAPINHCTGGMVGCINCNDFTTVQSAAKSSSGGTIPSVGVTGGQVVPAAGASSSSSASSASSSSASSSSSSAASTSSSASGITNSTVSSTSSSSSSSVSSSSSSPASTAAAATTTTSASPSTSSSAAASVTQASAGSIQKVSMAALFGLMVLFL